jgi:hypothetical protein
VKILSKFSLVKYPSKALFFLSFDHYSKNYHKQKCLHFLTKIVFTFNVESNKSINIETLKPLHKIINNNFLKNWREMDSFGMKFLRHISIINVFSKENQLNINNLKDLQLELNYSRRFKENIWECKGIGPASLGLEPRIPFDKKVTKLIKWKDGIPNSFNAYSTLTLWRMSPSKQQSSQAHGLRRSIRLTANSTWCKDRVYQSTAEVNLWIIFNKS